MTLNKEPKHLRQGKEVHTRIQKKWHRNAEGFVESEKKITKPSGRKGRMDIFVTSDKKLVAIVEIKASDWDTMTLTNICQNVRRQARQVWDYIESQLKLGKDVSPGIIFHQRPKDSNRMKLIDHLFNEEGISVVWNDETIAERKIRS